MNNEKRVIDIATQHGNIGFTFSYDQLIEFVDKILSEERERIYKNLSKSVHEVNEINKIFEESGAQLWAWT